MAPIRQIIKLIALALFLFSNPVYSQGVSKTVRAQNSIYPFCFTKLGVTNIARGGASVAELGCPIAAFSNPAGLSSDKVIIYFEAGKRFAADWLYDLKWDNQFILPAYATIVKPMKRGSISIGYLNYYSLRRELEMEITTISQPEGTGEMLTATTEMNVHSLFCAGSYCLNPMSNVGLTIGLNYLRHQDKMYHRSIAKGQGFGFQLIVGGLLTPIEKLKLGAAFRYATGINYDMKMEGRVLLVQIDVDSSVWGNNPNINASFTTISFPFTAEFPWSLEIGMSYELSGDVNLLAMLDFQKWSMVSEDFADKIQVHVGSEISILQPFSISCGFFTQYSPYFLTGKYLDQKFITAGFELLLSENLVLAGSIMDSHIFSNKEFEKRYGDDNDQFHQTYLASGVSIGF